MNYTKPLSWMRYIIFWDKRLIGYISGYDQRHEDKIIEELNSGMIPVKRLGNELKYSEFNCIKRISEWDNGGTIRIDGEPFSFRFSVGEGETSNKIWSVIRERFPLEDHKIETVGKFESIKLLLFCWFIVELPVLPTVIFSFMEGEVRPKISIIYWILEFFRNILGPYITLGLAIILNMTFIYFIIRTIRNPPKMKVWEIKK